MATTDASRPLPMAEPGRLPSARVLTDTNEALAWLRAHGVSRLVSNSRDLKAGDAFLAWPGARSDGRQFLADAWQRGAAAALIEAEAAERWLSLDAAAGADAEPRLPVAVLPGLKHRAGLLASAWWGHPSRSMRLLAVTGTNGKTSTSWWLAQALSALGQPCGVAGTLGLGQLPQLDNTGLTTPDALALQQGLAQMQAAGVQACAMEASSIGLEEGRLAGCQIDTALFSNFTQDHLDYHGTMEAYWAAKCRLFAGPGLRAAVLNVGDPRVAELARALINGDAGAPGRPVLDVWTVCQIGAEHPAWPSTAPSATAAAGARLVAHRVEHAADGLRFIVTETGAQPAEVQIQTPIIGGFHVDNLLLVLGGLRALGVPLETAAGTLRGLYAVPGRLQRVDGPAGEDGPAVVVDYAHTPDALQKVLATLRPWAQQRQGRLWCVFGCGGDRDPAKRPVMGRLALQGADQVVLTSDNPRREDPHAILADIGKGIADVPVGRVIVEADRRVAIQQAITLAAPQDVVLLAGKGHEDYQEVHGRRLPFSDAAVAEACLQAHARGGRS